MMPGLLPGASVPSLVTEPAIVPVPPSTAPAATETSLAREPLTTSTPSVTSVNPVKVLAAVRSSEPFPACVTPPDPEMTPLTVLAPSDRSMLVPPVPWLIAPASAKTPTRSLLLSGTIETLPDAEFIVPAADEVRSLFAARVTLPFPVADTAAFRTTSCPALRERLSGVVIGWLTEMSPVPEILTAPAVAVTPLRIPTDVIFRLPLLKTLKPPLLAVPDRLVAAMSSGPVVPTPLPAFRMTFVAFRVGSGPASSMTPAETMATSVGAEGEIVPKNVTSPAAMLPRTSREALVTLFISASVSENIAGVSAPRLISPPFVGVRVTIPCEAVTTPNSSRSVPCMMTFPEVELMVVPLLTMARPVPLLPESASTASWLPAVRDVVPDVVMFSVAERVRF